MILIPNDQLEGVAAAAIMRTLDVDRGHADNLVAALDDDELLALVSLPGDDSAKAIVFLVVRSARMRQSLAPVVEAVLNAMNSFEATDREAQTFATNFAAADGRLELETRSAAERVASADAVDVIGPRPGSPINNQNRRVRRMLGDDK